MESRLTVSRRWVYDHGRQVDTIALAKKTGDTLIGDLGRRLVLLDADGNKLWDETADFAPLKTRITETGDAALVLTNDGYLLRLGRNAEIEWDVWVEKHPLTLALKSRGQAAAVGSMRARLHVINNAGKRIKLLHTPEPVVFARFSSRTGGLFAASAHGWVGLYDKAYKPMRQYNLGLTINKIEVSERGRKIFCPARELGLQVIEVEDSKLATYEPGFPVSNVAIDQRGDRIVVAGLDGQIALLDSSGHSLWSTGTKHSWAHCEMTRSGDTFVLVSDRGFTACYAITAGKSAQPKKSPFDYLEV